jgi:hypothetical protein
LFEGDAALKGPHGAVEVRRSLPKPALKPKPALNFATRGVQSLRRI